MWQLLEHGFRRTQVDRWLRSAKPPKVHWGVFGEPGPLGDLMAATFALGKEAAISHRSGVELWEMRERTTGSIHVSVPTRGGRDPRDGIVVHRPMRVVKAHRHGIPVMTPTQCLSCTSPWSTPTGSGSPSTDRPFP